MSTAVTLTQPRKRVLVVDDDLAVLQLVSDILKGEHVEVTTANDGQEALDRFAVADFDLLICDVWMPNINGLDLLTRLRALKSPPPAIVMTADDAPATTLTALREAAVHVIGKPFQPRALMDLVAKVLENPWAAQIRVLSSKPDWVEIEVPCDLEVVDRLQEIMMRLKNDLPEQVRSSVGQAFRELLLNAIEWGGELDPKQSVRISYIRVKRLLMYRISDPGPGFRMEGLAHAAINNPESDPIQHMKVRDEKGLRPGGLGILMTKALVDDLIYNEAHNEVVFVKYLD